MTPTTDQMLETIKVIFTSDKALTTGQVAKRVNVNRRTAQRHIKRLSDAGIIAIKQNKYETREWVCERII